LLAPSVGHDPGEIVTLLRNALGLIICALVATPLVFAQQEKDKSATKAESNREGKQAKKGGQDSRAVRSMAQANMAEVELGKLAADRASGDEVKKFGRQMVEDHGKQLDEVKKLAQGKNVQLPDQPAKKHQSAMKKLQGLSGADFDRAYMRQMVKDHEDTLKQLESIAKKSDDLEVKAAAEKAVPKVKEHLQMAQQMAGSAKRGDKKGSKKDG
jgi:putative membrane protein